MVRIIVVSGLVGFLLGTTAWALDPPLQETLRVRWMAAYNSGDVEALGAVYAPDARLQEGYCSAVAGRAAIEDFWREDMGDATSKTHLEVVDTVSVEDLVYLSGTYTVEIAATPPKRLGGAYVQVWRREGSSDWAIVRETWTNLACAELHIGPDDAERETATPSPSA